MFVNEKESYTGHNTRQINLQRCYNLTVNVPLQGINALVNKPRV